MVTTLFDAQGPPGTFPARFSREIARAVSAPAA